MGKKLDVRYEKRGKFLDNSTGCDVGVNHQLFKIMSVY